jgi:hypothetical protein
MAFVVVVVEIVFQHASLHSAAVLRIVLAVVIYGMCFIVILIRRPKQMQVFMFRTVASCAGLK